MCGTDIEVNCQSKNKRIWCYDTTDTWA